MQRTWLKGAKRVPQSYASRGTNAQQAHISLEKSLAHLQLSQSGTLSLYREAALRKICPHCTMPPMMLPRNMMTMHSSTKSCRGSSRAQLRSQADGWLPRLSYLLASCIAYTDICPSMPTPLQFIRPGLQYQSGVVHLVDLYHDRYTISL